MSQEAQSRLPEWVSKPAVRIAAGALALGAPLAACGGDDAGDNDPGFTPNSAHTLTVEPTNTPKVIVVEVTPTPTATPSPEPTPTPTPTETVAETPCVIFPQEFCDDGTVFEDSRFPGLKFIGFNLPEGTPIYAHRGGITVYDKSGIFPSANLIQVINPSVDQSVVEVMGDVAGVKATSGGRIIYTDSNNTKPGEQIGVVGNTGVRVNDKFNVVVDFGTHSASGYVTDNATLTELFPKANTPLTK